MTSNTTSKLPIIVNKLLFCQRVWIHVDLFYLDKRDIHIIQMARAVHFGYIFEDITLQCKQFSIQKCTSKGGDDMGIILFAYYMFESTMYQPVKFHYTILNLEQLATQYGFTAQKKGKPCLIEDEKCSIYCYPAD